MSIAKYTCNIFYEVFSYYSNIILLISSESNIGVYYMCISLGSVSHQLDAWLLNSIILFLIDLLECFQKIYLSLLLVYLSYLLLSPLPVLFRCLLSVLALGQTQSPNPVISLLLGYS